jgi:hypothetical protein
LGKVTRKGKNENIRKIFTLSIPRGAYLVDFLKNTACREGDGEL